jgi:hypothetical protein
MALRRKKTRAQPSGEDRAARFKTLQQTLGEGQNVVADVMSRTSSEVRLAINQAHASVMAAAQTMSAGSRVFEEASGMTQAGGDTGRDPSLPSGGNAAFASAKNVMLERLKRVSESFSQAANWGPAALSEQPKPGPEQS